MGSVEGGLNGAIFTGPESFVLRELTFSISETEKLLNKAFLFRVEISDDNLGGGVIELISGGSLY